MKWIKKIILGLLIFILIDIIAALALSFNLKNIIINGVIKEVIKVQIEANKKEEGNYEITKEQINSITDDERVREILNSDEVQDLLNKYLDTTINGLIDENSIDDINWEKDAYEFVKNNKSVLEEKLGTEITDEMLEETRAQMDEKDFSNAYKQSLRNASKTMTKEEKTVLKGYNIIISVKFKIILIIAMLIDLLLIALIQWSLYKWIKTLGKSMIVSGLSIVIMSLAANAIVKSLIEVYNFKTTSLTYTGIAISTVGLIIVIIYKIILKLVRNDKNEISKISSGE